MTPRFFHPQPLSAGQTIEMTDSASYHALKVLRLTDASELVLFNGDGHPYSANLAVTGKKAFATIVSKGPADQSAPIKRVLAQALLSNDKMAWVIEKAVELGVDDIVLIASQASKVRVDAQRGQAKQQRWQDIVYSACAQCGRNTVPQVIGPLSFEAFVSSNPASSATVLFEPGNFTHFNESLQRLIQNNIETVRILVGPESGFTAEELQFANQHKVVTCSLGWRVLRTETAGLAALAMIEASFKH